MQCARQHHHSAVQRAAAGCGVAANPNCARASKRSSRRRAAPSMCLRRIAPHALQHARHLPCTRTPAAWATVPGCGPLATRSSDSGKGERLPATHDSDNTMEMGGGTHTTDGQTRRTGGPDGRWHRVDARSSMRRSLL